MIFTLVRCDVLAGPRFEIKQSGSHQSSSLPPDSCLLLDTPLTPTRPRPAALPDGNTLACCPSFLRHEKPQSNPTRFHKFNFNNTHIKGGGGSFHFILLLWPAVRDQLLSPGTGESEGSRWGECVKEEKRTSEWGKWGGGLTENKGEKEIRPGVIYRTAQKPASAINLHHFSILLEINSVNSCWVYLWVDIEGGAAIDFSECQPQWGAARHNYSRHVGEVPGGGGGSIRISTPPPKRWFFSCEQVMPGRWSREGIWVMTFTSFQQLTPSLQPSTVYIIVTVTSYTNTANDINECQRQTYK